MRCAMSRYMFLTVSAMVLLTIGCDKDSTVVDPDPIPQPIDPAVSDCSALNRPFWPSQDVTFCGETNESVVRVVFSIKDRDTTVALNGNRAFLTIHAEGAEQISVIGYNKDGKPSQRLFFPDIEVRNDLFLVRMEDGNSDGLYYINSWGEIIQEIFPMGNQFGGVNFLNSNQLVYVQRETLYDSFIGIASLDGKSATNFSDDLPLWRYSTAIATEGGLLIEAARTEQPWTNYRTVWKVSWGKELQQFFPTCEGWGEPACYSDIFGAVEMKDDYIYAIAYASTGQERLTHLVRRHPDMPGHEVLWTIQSNLFQARTMDAVGDELLISGGKDKDGQFADMSFYNVQTKRWRGFNGYYNGRLVSDKKYIIANVRGDEKSLAILDLNGLELNCFTVKSDYEPEWPVGVPDEPSQIIFQTL